VAQNANIIELNGNRYNALTGELLSKATETVAAASHSLKVASTASARSIDGFIQNTSHHVSRQGAKAEHTKADVAPAPIHAAVHKTAHPISDFVRTPAHHLPVHTPSKAKTLMRHTVQKPKDSLKRQVKAATRTDVLVKQPSITVKPKLSSYSLDPKRVSHAKQTPRSPYVSRYQTVGQALKASQSEPAPTALRAEVAVKHSQPAQRSTADISREAAASMDIFERALARANSHEQKPVSYPKSKRRRSLFGGRALSIAAASMAVVLLVGFFVWQDSANLTMRYAASKAGVAATLPGYKPGGFSVGKFTYSAGIVAVNFKNAQTGDSFALVQKSSGWDSQALRDNFVASQDSTYQTIDAAGQTIYTYGNNNATWVNGGIWYQVQSHGDLSTNQLVELAVSM
jgi:hypothetical protein